MATRSNIYLRLKNESKGQTIKFNPNLIQDGYASEFPIPDVKIPQNANFIGIYHHWSGYIADGLGETLQTKYNDYDKILNLLIMGDMDSINDDVISYRNRCDKKEECPAKFYTEENLSVRQALQYQYAYLFDNGKWYVCYGDWVGEDDDYIQTEWLPLDEQLKKEKENNKD